MALRRSSAYRSVGRAYTRKSRVQIKNYIKAFPASRIVKHVMGDASKFMQKGFPFVVSLISKEAVQVRDTAIESARLQIHRELETALGTDHYFALTVYPHHVLRENKMLTGAGADRMQTGMSQSFGAPTNLAVQLKPGKRIFVVAVNNPEEVITARNILDGIRSKIPVHVYIEVKPIKEFSF